MTKYEYNKKYIAENRDLVNQRRRQKYRQDKLNNPVDKPKQVRKRKPIEDKKTKDIKEYQKQYRLKNKEKIAERQKLYVQKNYDKIAKQKTDWQKEHRIKKVKEKTIKPVKIKPIKPIKLKVKKQKNYLNNDDLLQQIILCKAQGSISQELVNMIQKIANGISKKLYYDNLEDKKDCIQEGITQMIINYHKFNETKYNNPLAYLSEICKRGMVKSWNEIHYRKQYFVIGSKKQTEFIQLPVINCEWL
jgi:2-succinyl-5-enolpyruvyl-6-hydroxy-3-cyclohexene-1-carboxylate synthase